MRSEEEESFRVARSGVRREGKSLEERRLSSENGGGRFLVCCEFVDQREDKRYIWKSLDRCNG